MQYVYKFQGVRPQDHGTFLSNSAATIDQAVSEISLTLCNKVAEVVSRETGELRKLRPVQQQEG